MYTISILTDLDDANSHKTLLPRPPQRLKNPVIYDKISKREGSIW